MRINILAAMLAITVGLCAVPGLAFADTTQTMNSCTGDVGRCVRVVEGDTTLTMTVDLPRGRTYFVVFNADITSSSDTGAVTALIEGPCADSPASTSTCQGLYVDEDLLGGLAGNALTGNCSLGLCRRHGLPGGLYFVTFSADAAAGEEASLNFEVETQ